MNYTEIVAVFAFDPDLYLAEEWIRLWFATKKGILDGFEGSRNDCDSLFEFNPILLMIRMK
jgi:hypothetical protein